MNIMQLISAATNGGAEKHTKLISQALARMGHQVVLVYPPGPYGSVYREAEVDGVITHEVSDIRRDTRYLNELIDRYKIDVIHSHLHRADWVAAALIRNNPHLKGITTIHSLFGQMENSWKYRIQTIRKYPRTVLALHKMDYVIATSRSAVKFLKKMFFLPDDRIAFFPNSIDTNEINSFLKGVRQHGDIRQELGLPESARIIVCAAVLEERKGQASLIEALALLGEDLRKNTHLVLAGDGGLRTSYENLAAQFGLAEQVHFLGFRSDAWRFMKSADVYVQPSVVDPLPRALLEAMYLEVPVIGTCADGIPDVISHRETGFLVNVNDAKGIADALAYAFTSSDIPHMVQKAKARILERHTMEGMAKQITNLLEEG